MSIRCHNSETILLYNDCNWIITPLVFLWTETYQQAFVSPLSDVALCLIYAHCHSMWSCHVFQLHYNGYSCTLLNSPLIRGSAANGEMLLMIIAIARIQEDINGYCRIDFHIKVRIILRNTSAIAQSKSSDLISSQLNICWWKKFLWYRWLHCQLHIYPSCPRLWKRWQGSSW